MEQCRDHGQALAIGECGLCLHPHFGFLGASPDRIVVDEGANPPVGLVGVKCPFTSFSNKQTIIEAALHREHDFCCKLIDGCPSLTKHHAYTYQVQGQLAITGLEWCNFVVWLGKGQVFVQRIWQDKEMWEDEMLPALLSAYEQYMELYGTG